MQDDILHNDKRKHARYAIDCQLKNIKSVDDKIYDADVLEISAGGVQFSSLSCFKKGEVIKVEVKDRCNPEEYFCFKGTVVWTQTSSDNDKLFLTGIKFLDLSDDELKALLDFIASHLFEDDYFEN